MQIRKYPSIDSTGFFEEIELTEEEASPCLHRHRQPEELARPAGLVALEKEIFNKEKLAFNFQDSYVVLEIYISEKFLYQVQEQFRPKVMENEIAKRAPWFWSYGQRFDKDWKPLN